MQPPPSYFSSSSSETFANTGLGWFCRHAGEKKKEDGKSRHVSRQINTNTATHSFFNLRRGNLPELTLRSERLEKRQVKMAMLTSSPLWIGVCQLRVLEERFPWL